MRQTIIRQGDQSAIVGGEFQHHDTVHQRYVKLEPGQQWIFQNQELVKKHADAHSQLGVDYISADTIRLFYDSPSFRRHHLDTSIQKQQPELRMVYRQYERVIQQRIESVKYGREWPAVYHERWQALGTQIIHARQAMLETLESQLQPLIQQFPPLAPTTIQIQYQPVIKTLADYSSPVDGYRVGPHVDDWGIEVNGQLVSQYYSRGINRILALIIAGISIQMAQPDGQTHCLLLDDPFIELDAANKAAIMQYLWNQFYCIYATTSIQDHPDMPTNLDQFCIQGGRIRKSS